MFEVEQIVGEWVAMWNSYNLSQIDKLFLTDENLTYQCGFLTRFNGFHCISGALKRSAWGC